MSGAVRRYAAIVVEKDSRQIAAAIEGNLGCGCGPKPSKPYTNRIRRIVKMLPRLESERHVLPIQYDVCAISLALNAIRQVNTSHVAQRHDRISAIDQHRPLQLVAG